MNLSDEFNLPKIVLSKPRCEPDYYGASNIIAENLGLRTVPISDAGWLHGWRFQKPKMMEEIVLASSRNNSVQLVANIEQELFLSQFGVRRIYAVGTPFVYAIDEDYIEKRIPISSSILVMPPHSLPGLDVKTAEDVYIRYVIENVEEGDFICFCIHQNCEATGKWVNSLARHKIPYVVGARIEDRNGLKRMAGIYSRFERMTTNSFGSHILQASLCGLKVSFCGPGHDYEMKSQARVNKWIYKSNYQEAFRNLREGRNASTLMKQYPQFFTSISDARDNREWAIKESGYDLKKDWATIAEYLGWDHHIRNWIEYHTLRYLRLIVRDAEYYWATIVRKRK